MYEIEPPFLSSVLKGNESKIDICSILIGKEKQSIEKQKADIEQLLSQQRLRKVNEREMKRHTMKNLYKN